MIKTASGQDLRLSPTRLDEADTCMRMFKLKHIDEHVSDEASKYLSFGSNMHLVMELAHVGDEPPTLDEMLKMLDKYWFPFDYELKARKLGIPQWQALGYESQAEEIEWHELGANIVKAYHEKEIASGNYLKSWQSEFYFRVPLIHGYEVSGVIDRIVQLPNGKYRIIDWKTSQSKKKPEDLQQDYQMALYWWAAQQVLGLKESELEDCGHYPAASTVCRCNTGYV